MTRRIRKTHLQSHPPTSHELADVGESGERRQIVESVSRVMTEGSEMDQDARDDARDAHSRIDTVEALFTDRWNQAANSVQELKDAILALQKTIDGMKNRMIGNTPAAIIAALTGLVGWLGARAFPIH